MDNSMRSAMIRALGGTANHKGSEDKPRGITDRNTMSDNPLKLLLEAEREKKHD